MYLVDRDKIKDELLARSFYPAIVAGVLNRAEEDVVRCKDCRSRVHDKAADEYWCDNPVGLCGQVQDDDFCPYGRTEER